MCGLFASIGFAPESERIDRVAHRGPDGRGWQVFTSPNGPVALGHRRLAIIDTSDAGLQPFNDEPSRFHIILNGEIYNYIELRDELKAVGHTFKTATDTEVLLHAFIEWGEDALNRLLGMFAFVIWDDKDKRLFAARDRYGIKPLYLTLNPTGLALASEIKQLIGLPSLSGRANGGRLRDFLAFGVQDHTAETLFEGVTQIRGGECLSLDCSQATLKPIIRRWYALPSLETRKLSPSDAAEQFHALLEDSIRLHLRADVQVGSCLSGGLDSSSIVALVSALLTNPVERQKFTTVSAVYPGTNVDESPFVNAMVAATGFNACRLTPDPADLRDNLDSIIHLQDEPFGSTSILSQWSVFKAAKEHGIKVMLDGQGADEQLAGYQSMIAPRMADLLRQGRMITLAKTLKDRLPRQGLGGRGKLQFLQNDMASVARQFIPSGVRSRLRGIHRQVTQGDWLIDRPDGQTHSAETISADSLGLPKVTGLDSLCRLLTHGNNLPMLLHWEDRNSMAHGIEARVPFLDHRLVEFSLGLPGDNKFEHALTKRVLRDAMGPQLPAKISGRRDKLGFATPEADWVRGHLRERVEEGVRLAAERLPSVFNAQATHAFANQRLNAVGPLDFTLWRIANTGLWAKSFGITSAS
jgi:asparagine synthase (glutamine-hydrolysing)